jgi:signal transduction histidine kinase
VPAGFMVRYPMLAAPRSWLRRLTLGQKLLTAFGLLSFLLMLSLIAILFYLNRINSYVERHNRITIPAVLTAAEMREMVYRGNAVANAALEGRDVKSSDATHAQLKEMTALILAHLNLYRDVHAVQTHPILYGMLRRHGQGALADEEAATLNEIATLIERVSQGWTVLAASLRNSSASATDPLAELQQDSSRLIAAISRLLQLHAKIDAEMKAEGDHLLRQAELVILALVSLVGLVVVIAYRLATTEIAQPLRQLAQTADRVAHHDLSAEFESWPAKDEVGTLAGSLRSMLAILRERTYSLERKTRGLESFTSSVAHDLKAPLREIEGFSSLLLRISSPEPQSQHYLQCIHAASLRMAALIEALLRYARLERETLPTQRVPLRPLVDGLIAERLASWTLKLPRISTDLPYADILAEPHSLRQALGNLLDNALKFVPKDHVPEVKIGGRMTPTERIVWIQDNGIGFEPRSSDRIFELFERLHTDEEYEGTGVGLAIVKLVMDKHGGRVWAESSPGKGSTFYLAFPDKAVVRES